MSAPTPERILAVSMGFWPAKTLLSAVELNLFTHLGSQSLTGAELVSRLGLNARLYPFWGALTEALYTGRPQNEIKHSGKSVFEELYSKLVEFGDAFNFTAADLFGWCCEAGFSRTEVIPLGGPASAGIAYK